MDQNKQLVESFFAALNRGAIPEAFALVADDVSWWVPGTLPFSGTKTKAEYMVVVGLIQTGFPGGLAFELRGLTAEGERVAVEVESLGKHISGKTYNNRYHFLFVVRGGRIVAVKEYMDTLHLKELISA
jgi:uncharacterized protein